MATAGNIGGFLGGFNQNFWPMFQQLMQRKAQEQAQQEEQNRKYAYDASQGKLVPVNPSLTMLPGLGGSTNMAQGTQPRMISPLQLNTGVSPAAYMKQEAQPGSTYIPGGMGMQGGYYTPKLAEDKDSFEYLQKLEKMKTDEGIRRDKSKIILGIKDIPKGFEIAGYNASGQPLLKKIDNKKSGITETSAQSQAYREAKDEADLKFGIAGFVPEDRKKDYQSYLNKRKQEIYQEKMGGGVDKSVKNIQDGLSDPGRNKAIKFLEDNNAPITDANIEAVKKKYRW